MAFELLISTTRWRIGTNLRLSASIWDYRNPSETNPVIIKAALVTIKPRGVAKATSRMETKATGSVRTKATGRKETFAPRPVGTKATRKGLKAFHPN